MERKCHQECTSVNQQASGRYRSLIVFRSPNQRVCVCSKLTVLKILLSEILPMM